jgi:hypothetical protein
MDIPRDSPFQSLIARCWDQDPKRRPTFKEVYDELDTLKTQIKRNSSPFQEMITQGFKGQEQLPWNEFCNLCIVTLGAAPRALEDIKFLIGMTGWELWY